METLQPILQVIGWHGNADAWLTRFEVRHFFCHLARGRHALQARMIGHTIVFGVQPLLIFLRTTDDESISVQLDERGLGSLRRRVWISKNPPMRITRYSDGEISIRKDFSIGSSDEEITEQVLLHMADADIQQSGGVEYTNDSDEDNEEYDNSYAAESIRVDTKPFNISLVYEMIEDGDINLSPDFQRKFVWTDVGAQSRLIESIMLRIPLPNFYMAQDRNGTLQVIDGLQRLTVIRRFLNNKFRLKNLRYLREEEGKYFRHPSVDESIDQRFRKRIMQTQIIVNIIDPQTPMDVKFDIFKRINQGGRSLNAQEIRNCMSSQHTRNLIQSLSSCDEFLTATGNSIGLGRMQDQELVLRFLAFRLAHITDSLDDYSGGIVRLLDNAIDSLNDAPDHVLDSLHFDFVNAMKNAYHLFGEYAFRKCLPEHLEPSSGRRLINSALFTTWSLLLADYSLSSVKRLQRGCFAQLLSEELADDDRLFEAVTTKTNTPRNFFYTLNTFDRLCRMHI